MSRYGDELVRKKIDSMSQLDRIEYQSLKNHDLIWCGVMAIASLIIISLGLLIAIKGVLISELPEFIIQGISLEIVGALFILYAVINFIITIKGSDKNEADLKKFIQERSKK